MKGRHTAQLHIKDLKDLRLTVSREAIDIKVLQTLGTARDRPSTYGNMEMSGMSDGDAGLVKVGFLIVLGFFCCTRSGDLTGGLIRQRKFSRLGILRCPSPIGR